MASSKIVITFGDDISDWGSTVTVQFEVYDLEQLSGSNFVMYSTYSFPRIKKHQFTVSALPSPPEQLTGSGDANSYALYFATDYNSVQQNFLISVVGNSVTIQINPAFDQFNNKIFQNFSSTYPPITAVITNGTQAPFTLGAVGFTPATNICDDVKISIATGAVAEKIWLNKVQIETSNAANPYLRDIPRGILNRFRLEDALGNSIFAPETDGLNRRGYFIPKISEQNITVKVDQSILGASVIITVDQSTSGLIGFLAIKTNLVFTYSLNGVDYQSDNVFTGQIPGDDKILYVKDQFGCVTQKTYSVTDVSTADPYLFISKANSLNFSENEDWDNQTIFKNDDNTLSNQGLEQNKACSKLLFNTADTTVIQFHSNYDTPTVKVREEDGTETDITISKRSSNLSRYKAMDGWYYKYANGFLEVYFTAGNTYDEFDIINGSFTLNGNLPDFAIKGTIVEVGVLGALEVIDVVFDDNIQKKAMIFQYTYEGAATQDVITSIYDILPFEVYEFEVQWSLFGEGFFDVLIDNTDTYNGTVQHLSENVWVQNNHDDTLAIRYYNNNNRDIFYKYGIEHFIRIPFVSIEGVQLEESEINITDLTTSLITSSVHEANKITFDYLTKAEMRKLVIALSCDNVFINGAGYVKNGNCEVELLENTNLYQVTATMIRTNINYNNNRQGQLGIDDGTIDFNIPPFVFGDGGFIKSI